MPSDEFTEHFKTYVKNAKRAVKKDLPHDERRQAFCEFMNDGFGIKVSQYRTEQYVSQGRIESGYIDQLYNNLLVEYKRYFDEELTTGLDEIAKYFRAEQTAQYAFYTDLCRFNVYKRDGDGLRLIDQKNVTKLTPAEALQFFDSFFFSTDAIVPTSEDMVSRFGATSATYNSCADKLAEMWRKLESDPAAKTKFSQWQQLLSKVHGKLLEDADLFIRHTYLSALVKCLALVALPIKSQPTGERLLEIIDGHVFRANGYPNLVEEDFFAWVLSEATREDATSLVGTLLGRIKRYDLTKINEDLLKELYQNLVEPEERQESGEFYTPDWLADLVIKDSGYPDAVKACVAEQSPLPVLVDPACGSGTFIFRAIATARENGVSGDQLVAYCCSRLMGMDVHPLAVTISKINFVLGLALELAAYRDDVHTPIYIADALQDFYGAGGGNSIEISSAGPGAESDVPEPFSIPAALATNRELFDQVIDRMQRYAEHAGDVRKITDGYWKSLAKLGVDDAWRAELVANCRLLTAHVRNRTDSIWGYVLRNCSQPAFLRNTKADFVVGNPPWKALRTVSHKAYQESIKKQAIRHGLITKKEGKLFSSLELCTLFFAVCEREYLKPTGTISFVLNRSVLTGALQHTAFQAFGFSRLMDGQEVVTTPGNEPVFPMPFCVLTRCAGQGLNRDIPCTVLKGRVPRGNPSLDVVRPLLRFEQTQFTPPPPLGVHTYYSTRFKEGATLNPMACWYVSVSGTIPKKASAPITIETDASRSARGKKQWQNRRLCGAVEREFFYATMRGVNYVPFGVLAFDLIVSPLKPYEPANDVLTYGKAVKEGYSFLADWIKQVEELWAAEKSAGSPKTAVARLNHQNLLQCQIPAREYKVIFNKSGTHPSSVVLDAATVVGSVVGGVVVNGFIADSQTYTYSTASLEEAHYLCAIINAACVDKAVKPFQSSGQQKERDLHTKILRASPVPQFDGGDSRHTRLASLSVGCHAVVEKAKSEISRCGDKKRRTISREMLAEPLQQIDVLANEVIEEEKKSMLGESPLSDNARWF